MSPDNERKLFARIAKAGDTALVKNGYVTAIDILVGIEWLQAKHVEDWRRGRLPYLERAVIANLAKLSVMMHLFKRWANVYHLKPSETVYTSWTRDRHPIRFTKTGSRGLESAYRTHWVGTKRHQEKAADRLANGITPKWTPYNGRTSPDSASSQSRS